MSLLGAGNVGRGGADLIEPVKPTPPARTESLHKVMSTHRWRRCACIITDCIPPPASSWDCICVSDWFRRCCFSFRSTLCTVLQRSWGKLYVKILISSAPAGWRRCVSACNKRKVMHPFRKYNWSLSSETNNFIFSVSDSASDFHSSQSEEQFTGPQDPIFLSQLLPLLQMNWVKTVYSTQPDDNTVIRP